MNTDRTTLHLEQMGQGGRNPWVRVFDLGMRADDGGCVYGRAVAEDNGHLAVRYPNRGVVVYKLDTGDGDRVPFGRSGRGDVHVTAVPVMVLP